MDKISHGLIFAIFAYLDHLRDNAKFLKLQLLPKSSRKWKKLGEKTGWFEILVHVKIFDLRFAKFCLREN